MARPPRRRNSVPDEKSGSGQATGTLDRWGMVISAACLIHCLALPVATALLPFLAVSIAVEEWAHPLLLALALPITGAALWRGYCRHRLLLPALVGVTGLCLIAAALWVGSELAETAISVAGASLVAIAHTLNWKRHRDAPAS